jgi:uncharacterized protein YbjQ (UPF0145 family)
VYWNHPSWPIVYHRSESQKRSLSDRLLGGEIADLLGARAEGFQKKLRELRKAALHELRNQAFQIGADAVVGVDLDYMILANNILTVVANGTAVKLAPIQSDTDRGPADH